MLRGISAMMISALKISAPKIGRRQSAVLKREFVVESSLVNSTHIPFQARGTDEALCNLPHERERRRPHSRQPVAARREPYGGAVRAPARRARRRLLADRPGD